MSKTSYKLKNMFKSKEQIEVEARMRFNQNKRSFTKYYQELDESIKRFSKMARDEELSGNHAYAESCAAFVLMLQRTQVKVQGLLQRFEMMHSMQRLTGVMTNFMEACADMGFYMDDAIDLKSMWKNTAAMDQALSKLDAMSDQMESVFETIDSGMNSSSEEMMSEEEADHEADELLDKIMGRHNSINMTSSPAEKTEAVPTAAEPIAQEIDDTDERLRRMMQELKS